MVLVWFAVRSVISANAACKENAKLHAFVESSCQWTMLLCFSVKETYDIKRYRGVYRRICRASFISHMEKGLCIKIVMLVSFIFSIS